MNYSLFFRFCLVGVGNTLIDFGVFFLLVGGDVPYLFAQIFAYIAGMVNSYIWNRMWTFQVKQKASVQEVARFLLLNMAASGTTFVLLFIFHETGGMSLVLSKVIATGGGILVTFFGSRFWVFKAAATSRRYRES